MIALLLRLRMTKDSASPFGFSQHLHLDCPSKSLFLGSYLLALAMAALDLDSDTSLKELVAAPKDLDCQVSQTCQYIYGPDFRIKYGHYSTDFIEDELIVQEWQEFISNHERVLHQLMDLLFPEASSSWIEREQKKKKQLEQKLTMRTVGMHSESLWDGYPSESFWKRAVEIVDHGSWNYTKAHTSTRNLLVISMWPLSNLSVQQRFWTIGFTVVALISTVVSAGISLGADLLEPDFWIRWVNDYGICHLARHCFRGQGQERMRKKESSAATSRWIYYESLSESTHYVLYPRQSILFG